MWIRTNSYIFIDSHDMNVTKCQLPACLLFQDENVQNYTTTSKYAV